MTKRARFPYLLTALLLITILASAQYTQINAQEFDADETFVELNFAPSVVEAGEATYSIGYVNIVSGDGFPALAIDDLEITLSSQNSTVASVPSTVVIPKNQQYAKFDVTVGDEGETEISAIFQDQIISKNFKVAAIHAASLEDVKLQVNLPKSSMNVNSEMPMSVFLQGVNETLVTAPKDIVITLDYNKNLLKLDDDQIKIKQGDYYGLTTVRTLGKAGSAFIRATAVGEQKLSSVGNVQISSDVPLTLKIYVLPGKVSRAEFTIDIFVGLLDLYDLPTFATEDVRLNLFTDSNDLANFFLKTMQERELVIKKNEYGFHLRQDVFFSGPGEFTVGVSAPGLKAATTKLSVVESLYARDPKAGEQKLAVWTVQEMPTDAWTIVAYQLNTVERDSDDCPSMLGNATITVEVLNDCTSKGFRNIHPIDFLNDGELYPIESNVIHSKEMPIPMLDVQASDARILKVGSASRINIGSSYGIAKMFSSATIPEDATLLFEEELAGITGETITFTPEEEIFRTISESLDIPIAKVSVSASSQGVGRGESSLVVVGKRSIDDTMIFSPAGEGKMTFNKEGYADLFVITLDSSERPIFSRGIGYVLRPFNQAVSMKPDESFGSLQLHSSLLGKALQEGSVTIEALPVGADVSLELIKESTFELIPYLGTYINVILPFKDLVGFGGSNSIGVVQLADSLGNPVLASSDLTVKLGSSNSGVVQVPPVVTIKEGSSFAEFAITTFSKVGSSAISANTEGLFGSQADINSVLARLPASFIEKEETIRATVETDITISALEGTNVLWAVPRDMEIVSKDDIASTYDPETDSYLATLQVIPKIDGDFTITVSLIKDGYETTKLSQPITIEPYLILLSFYVEAPPGPVEFNQTVSMNIFVDDENGESVEDAAIQLTGNDIVAITPSLKTDDSGGATVVFRPTTGPQASLTLVATKEGYIDAEETVMVDVTGFEPPASFFGLPPWVLYAGIAGMVGGIAVVVMVFFRKPKELTEEEEEEI